jgi:hypothetical protein
MWSEALKISRDASVRDHTQIADLPWPLHAIGSPTDSRSMFARRSRSSEVIAASEQTSSLTAEQSDAIFFMRAVASAGPRQGAGMPLTDSSPHQMSTSRPLRSRKGIQKTAWRDSRSDGVAAWMTEKATRPTPCHRLRHRSTTTQPSMRSRVFLGTRWPIPRMIEARRQMLRFLTYFFRVGSK